jgi:hypothetical protein
MSEQHEDSDVYLKRQIPDGEYIASYEGYSTATMFSQKTAKVCLRFRIVEGPQTNTLLERWYSVGGLYGPPGENGKFKAKGQTSRMILEFLTCCPDATIDRLDRIPMTNWRGGLYRILVRTVDKNHERLKLPHQVRYSTIDCVLGRFD